MNKIFEKTNEDGSKIINYTDRIEIYDTNNKLCGILGNLDSYEDLQKKAELGEHYKHLYSEVKKRNDNAVEYIKSAIENDDIEELKEGRHLLLWNEDLDKLLRMLGEKDD